MDNEEFEDGLFKNTDEQNNENNENENAIEPTLDNGDGEIFDDSISLIKHWCYLVRASIHKSQLLEMWHLLGDMQKPHCIRPHKSEEQPKQKSKKLCKAAMLFGQPWPSAPSHKQNLDPRLLQGQQ